MTVKFIEPGGDADGALTVVAPNGFWDSVVGTVNTTTDFVHGSHLNSIKYAFGTTAQVQRNTILAQAGGRISIYFYINAFGSLTAKLFDIYTSANNTCFSVRVTSGGVLQIFNATVQIGTNGSTLSTGQWYRLCLAYTISSTSVNEFRLYKDGVSDISITNATLTNIAADRVKIGNVSASSQLDIRSSDHYVDDSTALTDTGDIWVTAKRPNANGTTNQFTTQIGSGGSGYGTGHSPQVNERPLDTTDGWSLAISGVAKTEEYNIESAATGDFNISAATIIDYMGWVSTKALTSETGQIIVNNVTSNIAITSTIKILVAMAGSATYPAGTGTDIGIVTATTTTTVSLYECGIVVAFIPGVASPANTNFFRWFNRRKS